MLTRSFKSYGLTAPFVLPTNFGFDLVITRPVNLLTLWVNIAAANYIQIHDTITALAGGEVPLKSFQATVAGGTVPNLMEAIGPIVLRKGLTIAISSTAGTYTAAATNYDVMGEIEEYEFDETQGSSVVGDTTTNSSSQVVWTDAQIKAASVVGRLKRAIVTTGSTGGFIVFTADGGNANYDATNVIPIAANTTLDIHFGVDGFYPQVTNPTTGVVTNGCKIILVSAISFVNVGPLPPAPTLGLIGSTGCRIKAWYV